jgi:CheY-like chemotaxis protein
MRQLYVLLAEDDEGLRRLFLYLLSHEGYEVKAVEDGEAALEALSVRKPDAVITDIQMPKVDGLSLIAWIRSQAEMESLPVIAMTSFGENIMLQAQSAGADCVLAKPADTQLCHRLNHLLMKTRQTW